MNKRAKQEHIEDKTDIAQQARIQGQRTLAKDKFYPALVAATVSVDEAKMLLQSISSIIMEDALKVLRERKVSDVKERLIKTLCPNGDREKEITALIEVLNSETLFDTKAQVEGMTNVIDYMIRTEMQGRTLNSFTPDWDLMMAK